MNFLYFMMVAALGFLAGPAQAQSALHTPNPTPAADTVAEFGQNSTDFSFLFVKMIFAMLIVIALAVVLLRYVLPKISMRRPGLGKTELQVVDRIPLDQKKALYVVEVEGRRILLAVSENHVGMVTELKKNDDQETT